VVFNSQIWVLGGHNAVGLLNDVWSSSDGMTWTQVTNAAAWSKRFNFGAVAFNGQMWVLGGHDGSLRNDVWSSSNGMTWTQVTNAAPWSSRYHSGAVTLNGQMWVLGGYDDSLRNDVWSSSDGMTWTQVTNTAAWSGRWTHRALALNGQMWVLGGDLCGGSLSSGCYSNDVWSSPDGVNWTLATNAAAWSGRGVFGAVALNGQMWVLGGYDGGYHNDVWSSQSTTPLQMTSITRSGNNVVLTWTTQGASNVVQATTNATGDYNTNNFVNLTNLVITTLTTNYVDVGGATNQPARYYRIREPQ
jgi:hypothetical protein